MNDQIFSKKYQVKHEIARGGMGTIYLATDTKLGRDVAIKRLHPQYSGESDFAQRFLREARAMAKLDHPNIIRIWSVEEEEGSHSIVMEYFPGKDLKQIIRNRGPLPITEALPITIQIIQGLAYAHYMGIIHRDIKPANILVDQEGKVKITDFGIAAALSESSLTIDGTVMGTPEYMAPEQARAEAVDSHTDLYSVGILMYELLTGQTPYKGIPAQTLVAKLAFGSENPSLKFPPNIPSKLQDLIVQLTQKRAEDRLKDINEILTILKTTISSSQEIQSDTEETALFSPDTASTRKISPSTHVIDQPQIFPNQIQQKILSNDSPKQPQPEEIFGTAPEEKLPIPRPILKLIMSAVGILAFLIISVLVVSQWPVDDLPPSQSPAPRDTASQSDTQDRVNTTIGNMEQLSQNIRTTEKEIDKEFESFSLAIRSLRGEIINKKMPSKYSDAQRWLDETKKDVAALTLNKREIENSQQLQLKKSKKAVASTMQQGEQLLQQDLSQDQQKQLHEATTTLKNTQQALEAKVTNHFQGTQNLLSRLEDVVKQSERTLIALARNKPPSTKSTPPNPAPNAAAQLGTLKTETRSLEKEIGNMFQTFEASTQLFSSQLSNLQAGIKQIQADITSDPSSTQKLEDVKDNLLTIQEKAQTAFSQQKVQHEKLKKTLQTTANHYQVFSQKDLNSSQKSELGKLNEILKNNENRLEAFPPDSWNTLQSLSVETQALMMASKKIFAQNTRNKLAEEVELKRQKEAEEARQKQAALQAEQQRLARLEAQRQQALARQEKESQLKAAEANRIAKVAEVARQEKEAQLAGQQIAKKLPSAETLETLKEILKDFTTAYENRDLLHLKLTTSMSESRKRNLTLMFKNYTTIDTHTKIVATSESQAKAKIFIDKLINNAGENVTPNFIIRETTITIPKNDEKWGKIQW